LAEQKEALMSDRLLSRRLRATVKLVDVETNKPLDVKKNFTLARVPYLTQRGTFINNGSEFSPVAQSRLLPGAYTRKRDNGLTECHFNVRPGSGAAMRVSMDPITAQYRVKLGTSDLHAYSLFKDLGVSDDELERRWGKPILDINRAKYSKDTLGRAYVRAVPKWERDVSLSQEDKAVAVRSAFDRAQVAESILKSNLPNLYSREKTAYWRMAGHALDAADAMSKSASIEFSPDMNAEAVMDAWQDFDFDLMEAVKEASFDPDISPDDMKDSYNSIYGNHGPRLASMRQWPAHWLDDQDKQGWLEWYKQYSDGRRSDKDDKQIARWKSFKQRHGAMFVRNPTPRRAFALVNWAIDPLEMLPHDKREAVKTDMDNYKNKEYMKWYMNRHDFDDGAAHKLGMKARDRGAKLKQATPDAGELMRLVLDGFITPADLT
jgi:DNA-directed RNA polymerase beta subunit